MALDPALAAETQEWLRRAANDLRAAEVDLAAAPPLLEDGETLTFQTNTGGEDADRPT